MKNLKTSLTVIEILTILALILTLFSIFVPFINDCILEWRIDKARDQLREIVKAIRNYEEKEYRNFSGDAFSLLGRYYNSENLPPDPWGTEFNFSSAMKEGGEVVFSHGPDTIAETPDDIVSSYKPPQTLVSVRWYDVNGDGLPSGSHEGYPATDTLVFRFNRAVETADGKPLTIRAFRFSEGNWAKAFTGEEQVIKMLPNGKFPKQFYFAFSREDILMNRPLIPCTVTLSEGIVFDKLGNEAKPAKVIIRE
ncbi:hypothetical protein ACFL35_07785 [Candidatus Riflebacteria bacterium]